MRARILEIGIDYFFKPVKNLEKDYEKDMVYKALAYGLKP